MERDTLWPLLTFDGLSEESLVRAYRQTYIDTYIRYPDGSKPVFRDWTGAEIIFSSWQFDHAFSKSDGYRQGLFHDRFALDRAVRMLWIKEVLQATAGTINRYIQSAPGSNTRRTFFVHEEKYLVVLDDRSAGKTKQFYFLTAYPVYDLDYLSKLKQKSTLIECVKGGNKKAPVL